MYCMDYDILLEFQLGVKTNELNVKLLYILRKVISWKSVTFEAMFC